MRMPNNPHSWAEFSEILASWWRGDVPMGAVFLSLVTAVLRVAYGGGGWKKTLLEGLLCGALTLTAVSALEYFDLPKSLSPAIGGLIGFVGVEQIRGFALRFMGNKFGGGSNAN
ncbi:phage holin, lambda family [Serratia fonticola]|uniref:phage holin, lambda family n=1 Tax=Serratia fonticola TaxID=47917 RepID=UPI0027F4D92D|nr:phage holin, lambda family [Serratia fonticola]MDQ7209027.1 phage holin, lambda family [Serratia fonticola]HBE9089593.1 phage holin, lambda family [Serratia fonticola]HBE9152312.1 phage holin, lambda family [Serratia fonticola]